MENKDGILDGGINFDETELEYLALHLTLNLFYFRIIKLPAYDLRNKCIHVSRIYVLYVKRIILKPYK